ncbi:MAG: GNAT family N-acetyltransferase [Gemmatimonadota bacterium]|nr:GNAT family N-acetyltransferase [Gemmatimonadota bacterium]
MIEIIAATKMPALADARALIRDHIAANSTAHDSSSTAALLDALPAPYEPPRGGLWLARLDSSAIGCVALHALGPTVGEIKRMYVHPASRRLGVARALLTHVIEEARKRRYDSLRLGTLTAMTPAQQLYESFGFRKIAPYRSVEFGDTLFYELTLDPPAA